VEPIPVPAPPKSSFNKNRRVSDLLLGQLKHFQHVEHKQGIQVDPALSRDIQTEAGAARYIAKITRTIRRQGQTIPMSQGVAPSNTATATEEEPAGIPEGLALAASSTPASASKAPATKKNKTRKRR
jgi:hypothetical protein